MKLNENQLKTYINFLSDFYPYILNISRTASNEYSHNMVSIDKLIQVSRNISKDECFQYLTGVYNTNEMINSILGCSNNKYTLIWSINRVSALMEDVYDTLYGNSALMLQLSNFLYVLNTDNVNANYNEMKLLSDKCENTRMNIFHIARELNLYNELAEFHASDDYKNTLRTIEKYIKSNLSDSSTPKLKTLLNKSTVKRVSQVGLPANFLK